MNKQLEIEARLPISLVLGAYKVPDGFETVGDRTVYDNKTGNCGVLVQNHKTGIYCILAPGCGLSSVDQREARALDKSLKN